MKEWVLKEPSSVGDSDGLKDYPELIRRVLLNRGIETAEDAEEFLNPDYEKGLHNPFLLSGMEKAVERILLAIREGECVVIFGDYDADGVSASVIFCEFFKKIGFENFHVHIPDRNLDGYGLSMEAVDKLIKEKTELIVTVDCGITGGEKIEKANAAGVDVIVTDHHISPDEPPPAFAIVDAKQKNDDYPFKSLCGTGVAFKVVQALIKRGDFNITPGWEKWLLELVAIATVADMVPLLGENRVLVSFGLKVLKKTRRPGLLSFFRRMRLKPSDVAEDDIAFMIAPRINIASRLDHANISLGLLTSESPEECDRLAKHLDSMNDERKKAVEDILKTVNAEIRERETPPSIIFEGDLDWHPGVLGIAANRLLEEHEVPVFLWGKGEGKDAKGSCRSKGSVNLVDLMKNLPEGLLLNYGGHAFAGGFSAEENKIGELKKEFLDTHKKMPKEKTENNILNIDMEMSIDDVNWNTWAMMEKLQPFGMDNPKPIFKFSGLEIDNVRKFGNGGIHLGLDFRNSAGKKVPAIGFFVGDGEKFKLKAGQKIDLAATLEKSFFAGKIELRLKIVDIKLL